MRKKQDSELTAAVAELAAAHRVSFGGVGMAGTLLPETEAYHRIEAVAADHPDQVREQLDRLLATATAAGRVYAATLLAQLDPAAGRAAWTVLRGVPDELPTATGCVLDTTTVGEYAAERLAGS
ncbi:hypothetical protein [Micromonospora radicis]|nr:hypothetical protein [Micromonospora radicis]